jgi:acyl-CoA synthetase (AMP-forming)/AMP-acid ligase II
VVIQLGILFASDTEEAEVDQPGELLVRHAGSEPRYGFFREYLKDAEATAAAWQGGWFHTGDVVRRGADGSLHFVDRKKNVIRRSGENISAVEVESVLMQHPSIRQVAVAPAPDPVRGDEVFACVVSEGPAPDAAARKQIAADIVAWCLSRLAYYKAPGYVAFVAAVPLTSTQKIQRGALKERLTQLTAELGAQDALSLRKIEREEIMKHKWIESEKAGRDIGFGLSDKISEARWLTEAEKRILTSNLARMTGFAPVPS